MRTPAGIMLAALLAATPGLAEDTVCLGPSAETGDITNIYCGAPSQGQGQYGYGSTALPPCSTPGCFLADPPPEAGTQWNFSTSVVDAGANVGGILNGQLYLWLACADGISGLKASVETNLTVLSFTPLNGFVNHGTATELDLVTPCVGSPVVAGILTVQSAVSVDSGSWGRIKATYE